MKRFLFVFLLLVGVVCANGEAKAQGVVYSLWQSIIKQNDIGSVKTIFWYADFDPVATEVLVAAGHNPRTTVIGMKGDNPTNSILAIVKSISEENHRIKEASFVCAKTHAQRLDADLKDDGYEIVSERRYREDGRFYVTEKTYDSSDHSFKIIIKFADGDGSGNATFMRK